MRIILHIMDKKLYTWLSQYVRSDSINYNPDLSHLIIDMFISDRCNLICKHCYFGETRTIGSLLSSEDWIMVINSLYAEGVRHFHISGRESSLDNRVIEIVAHIKNLEGTYSGLVSNGTGHPQFYKTLINEGINYLEFSIDGTEDTHNYIRGKNIYSQIITLLETLSHHSDIIDISTCLNQNSLDEYFSLIDTCLQIGIRKFFATPFIITGNGESFNSFSITPLQFSQLIEKSFRYLESKSGEKIALRYCIPHEVTFPLIEQRFIRQLLIDYLTDKSNLLYHIKGNVLQLSLNLLNVKFMNNISITSDGEVIPCSDYISKKNYHKYSIGNVIKTNISAILQKRAEVIINNLKTLQNGN